MLFALGVVMLELAEASNVHLDVEHALYGSLEAAVWIGPLTWVEALNPAHWASLPREIPMLLAVLAVLAIAMIVAFKEIRLTAFDPDYAAALGLPAWASELAINTAAALAVVAAFDAVGSILVIAMLICPAAAARLLTERLAAQIYVSLLIAGFVALGGYAAAAWGAPALGLPAALNAAGTIAVTGGVALAAAAGNRAMRRRRARALEPGVAFN
jgi:manganese/zinc/iron transport system permease protein